MDDMAAQGFGAIVIIYGGLIVITVGVVLFIMKFWSALVAGDTGFILWSSITLLVFVSMYAGGGLLLRKYEII
ncbi:MAG: hypothetical protein WCB46_10930 [Methanoregula sp.]|jgi:hypothetical protein